MKKSILLILVGLTILIAGCTNKTTCNPPYILVGDSCCLDQNDNKICDKDETQKTFTSEEIYEKNKDSVLYINNTCMDYVKYPLFKINYNYDDYNYYDYLELTIEETGAFEELESPTAYFGTGFIVNNKLITNSHVVSCVIEEEQLYFDEYFLTLLDYYNLNYYLTAEDVNWFVDYDIKQESTKIFNKVENENIDTEWTEESVEDYMTAIIAYHLYNNSEVTDARNYVLEAYSPKYGLDKKFDLTSIKQGEPFPGKDYAIFNLEGDGLNSLNLGDSTTLKVGEEIYVMGYPDVGVLNYTAFSDPSITRGIISSKKISEENVEYIEIDATSSAGNSGGPVFNKLGEVIGVLTAGADYVDINFIFPSKYLTEIGV